MSNEGFRREMKMEDIYYQTLGNSSKCKSWISCTGIHKYCIMLFLIVLLLSGWQDTGIAADDPNLSPEEVRRRLERRPETEKVFDSHLTNQEKINKIIQILDKELVEECLRRLDEIALYLSPGFVVTMDSVEINSILKIPLPVSVDQRDVVIIMGNRRFLKLMHELSLLPKETAADLVSREITSALSQYKVLFDSYMKKNTETFASIDKARNKSIKYLGFSFSTADGKPTLMAMRYKVLALVLIAGNLQLQQAQPAVKQVLENAIKQRDMFYNEFYRHDAAHTLIYGSLYNRQILGTAVLETYIGSDKAQQILKTLGCKFKSERLTRYNAAVTPHDMNHVYEMEPVDYSKGELTVKYLEPLDDAKFDAIVDAATTAGQ